MPRVTTGEVEARATRVSAMLRDGLHVVASGRNGYTALDLFDGHGVVRPLKLGTKREVYEYLGAMAEALTIVGR